MRKAFYLRHYEPAPCPPLDENARYNFTGQYLDDCSVLEVDAYDFEGNLAFRHFVNFDNEEYWTYPHVDIYSRPIYGYRPYDIKAGEWTQARIDTLCEGERMIEAGDHYSMTEELKQWIYHETEKAVDSSQYWGYSHIYRLEAWEKIAQTHRETRRARVRLENIREMFKDLPDKEQEIYEWARTEIFGKYVLVDSLKKQYRLCCTSCGETWRRKKKPRKETVCPHCGRTLLTTRKRKIHEKIRVYETEPFADGGIIRHYDIINEWKPIDGKWTWGAEVVEVQRALIDTDGKWKRSFWFNYYNKAEGYTFGDTKGYGNYIVNGKGYLYPKDIFYPDRTETDLRIYKAFADKLHRSDWNEKEFNAHNLPECMEYLIKSGLMNIAEFIINKTRWENHYQAYEEIEEVLDLSAGNLPDLLNLDSNMTARVKRMNIGADTLKYLQDHPGHYSDQDIKNLDDVGIENLMLNETGLTVTKATNYIAKQKEKGGFSSIEETKETYADYIHMAIGRGMDPHDDIVRRCSDLRRRHDELATEKELNSQKKRFKKCKGVKDLYKPYLTVYGWSDDKYTIVIPAKPEDIFREGQLLHHCVGREGAGYIEKHAAGKTLILFLRPADKAEDPWYTIEVDPFEMRIKQKYAAFDRQPELKTVDEELTKWRKTVSRRLKKPSKEVKAALELIKELTA